MNCPICLSVDGYGHQSLHAGPIDGTREECEVCGTFLCSRNAKDDYLNPERAKTTALVRACLSHWLRLRQTTEWDADIPLVLSTDVESAYAGDLSLPSPGQQATNIIRFVGDQTRETGAPLPNLPPEFHAVVGSMRREFSFRLLFELADEGLLTAKDASSRDGFDALSVRLTLRGWARYEAEQKGKVSGNYAFLALKFKDDVLDPFVESHVKPAVAELGYELRTMLDTARAGIIDNLMRIDIRDAAFVIADLTHDNNGSYWEAGYAEGLGKPVLYICERSKFAALKTHFDTNHSTTVQWEISDPDTFKRDLVATLKRSLIP
jgi:hypothetical protein